MLAISSAISGFASIPHRPRMLVTNKVDISLSQHMIPSHLSTESLATGKNDTPRSASATENVVARYLHVEGDLLSFRAILCSTSFNYDVLGD